MRYPGGKGKAYQHVINLVPPHSVYIEPFLGAGAVMHAKRRSVVEIGVDRDPRALTSSGLSERATKLIHGDGIQFLEAYPFQGHEVVYCDPPYVPESRRRTRVYRFDFTTADHRRLLRTISGIRAHVLVSGYDNNLYRQWLSSWNIYRFKSKAHDGLREEFIWYNFELPKALHDYRYLGRDFRERQTIKRRLARLTERIENLSEQERSYLRYWLSEQGSSSAA